MAALVQFDAQGRWGETLVCGDRVREALLAAGVAFSPAPGGRRGPRQGAGPPCRVLRVRGKPRLFYLAHAGGWLGLLCEAGEHARVPVAMRCIAARDVLEAGDIPAGLPAQDTFVDRLLEMVGDAVVDDAF